MGAIKFNSAKLISNGTRLNDEMIIKPLRGNKKKITLNRTKLYVSHSNLNTIQKRGYDLLLPSFKEDNYKIMLDLVELIDPVQKLKYKRFLLKSLTSTPFQINGGYSLNSFLERGDVIRIGYNQLIFQNMKDEKEFDFHGVCGGAINENLLVSDLNILLTGETGTGKSHFAKRIHDRMNCMGRFIALNLASFPPTLIESELFGYSRGAFTGAIKAKRGAFLDAHKGTLFLDEIDSLPLDIQTKLLLFLDNREVRPIGSSRTEKADIKIILASGRDLRELVNNGKMRRDFYFRIASELKVDLSPLRKRRDDILYFCKIFQNKYGVLISKELREFYFNYDWPGNIRQLMGHLRKKKIHTKGIKLDYDEVDDALLDDKGFYDLTSGVSEVMTMEEFKNLYTYQVSLKFQGSIKKTSKILKLSENTVREYLRKYKVSKSISLNQQELI